MMPEMDGSEALKQIRSMEEERGIISSHGAKIFMTTALDQMKNVIQAFYGLCDAYLYKPLEKAKLVEQLQEFRLIKLTWLEDASGTAI
jgi:two-component system chemotaxis response regulator CheY